jgi:metal-dependent amidase/aminoacylase/carboxypeptidase family protein
MLIEDIKEMAANISSSVIGNRRHWYAHPESSFQEYETSAFIKMILESIKGWPVPV